MARSQSARLVEILQSNGGTPPATVFYPNTRRERRRQRRLPKSIPWALDRADRERGWDEGEHRHREAFARLYRARKLWARMRRWMATLARRRNRR